MLNNQRNFGNSQSIRGREKVTVLDYSDCDANREAKTITIVLINLTFPASGLDQRGSALIDVGGAGCGVQLEVDYINGNTLTVPGSTVRVTAKNNSLDSTNILNLGAAMAEGALSRNNTLRLTQYTDAAIPNGGSVLFSVPRFGAAVTVYRANTATTAMLVRFLSGSGAILYDRPVIVGEIMTSADLAGDVRTVQVEATVGDLPSIRAVYDIVLG